MYPFLNVSNILMSINVALSKSVRKSKDVDLFTYSKY